jgi:hypothetical protein
MKRAVSVLAATFVAAVLVPSAALAANVQIGVTKTALVAPTCPADAQGTKCTILLTQVTAYETLGDGVANPDVVKQSGVVSSFTLGLTGTTTVTPTIYADETQKYGGQPEAQLTALIPTGTAASPSFRVVAQSEVVKLRSELGQVAEFPLTTPLPVVRGEVLALTIPTWAPVLSFELAPTQFAYVQSRIGTRITVKAKTGTTTTSSCKYPSSTNLAQVVVGELSNYGCTFSGTRIEYSALEITTPSGFNGEARRRAAAKRQR